MRIIVETVPHAKQRYDTLGDWVYGGDGTLFISVSELGDERMNALVAVHEIVEALLCTERGIAEPVVAAFDIAHPELDDPGGDPEAPYFWEHTFAELIERQIAHELGIDWTAYGAACEKAWEGR